MAVLPEGVGLDVTLQYVEKPTRTFLIDWSSKQIAGMDEGLPAMRQAVEIILQNERFRWQIYSSDFGSELENLVGRISANMILPYPPGVPLLMPGEMITEESRAVLDFLLMLCSIGRHYPGFETDIHGAKRDEDGVYRVRVLKNDERLAR